jgi:hypothetical protein
MNNPNLKATKSPHNNKNINHIQYSANNTRASSSSNAFATAIADTGASGNYMSYNDINKLINVKISSMPITVNLPDGSTITSTHEGDLKFDNIPPIITHIFPDMTSSLISIGHLCDIGLIATFDKDTVNISDNSNILLTGIRDTRTKLWMIELPQNGMNNYANNAIADPNNSQLFVARIHHAWGSPAPSTFLNAVSKGYIKVKGLNATIVRKYIHTLYTLPTANGHLDQHRQGYRSTKTTYNNSQPVHNKAQNTVQVKVIDIPQRYTDLTGQFPVRSSSGNLYHMIMYCKVSKYIHVELMKSRKSADFVDAYRRGTEFFKARGMHPEYERLDNESSVLLTDYCKLENIYIQYVPPGNHRANAAERAIRTWKNHFIAIMCGLDNKFPLVLWDELIQQAELTLNTLKEGIDESISAWESINGTYSYDRNPIAPLGMKVLCHMKPSERASWAPHGLTGFYTGPAMEHYRCYRIWIPSTKAIRITDSVAWDPATPPANPFLSVQASCTTELQRVDTLPAVHIEQTGQSSYITELQRVDTLPAVHIEQTGQSSSTVNTATTTDVTLPTPREWTVVARRNKCKSIPGNRSAFASVGVDKVRSRVKYRHAILAPDKEQWEHAATEEFERLINQTNTMHFIDHSTKPSNRLASYYNPQCEKKLKQNHLVYRIRGTVGGNVSDYDGDRTAWTADLETVKILLNAVVSDENSEWMTVDIKDFYLGTPLDRPEYMWIDRWQIPQETLNKYKDSIKFKNGKTMVEINKGIYGLPHAGKIAQDRLIKHLTMHGFHQTPNTNCLFRHESKPIAFTLVVDDFGIKYKGKDNAEYLLQTLRHIYNITVDWTGERYLGMHVTRDRCNNTISLSMPGYIEQVLKKLNVHKHKNDTHSPCIYTPPSYGAKVQYSEQDNSALLPPDRTKYIQRVCGNLLYYARAVDPTMLTAVLKISSNQAKPTVAVEKAALHLLQYAATHPNASITYNKSAMRLIVYSDASYLSETASRSRAGGYSFLADNGNPLKAKVNGAIECVSVILPTVCASAHEAEYAALFINGQRTENLKNILLDLGFPQAAVPIIGDNQTSIGVANKTKKVRRSQSMDMRYNWIRDRTNLGHFELIWHPGKDNLADYFTKIHPKQHYINMRNKYVTDLKGTQTIFERVC